MLFDFETKAGSYAVVMDGPKVLLVFSPEHDAWTLPGGGLNFGEDPVEGAEREVLEETGLRVIVDRLLGSFVSPFPDGLEGTTEPVEVLRLIYQARIFGGNLAREVSGSTSKAEWFPAEEISLLNTHAMVEPAMRLFHDKPANGRPCNPNMNDGRC